MPEEVVLVLPRGWADLIGLLDQGPQVDPMTAMQRLCALCAEVTRVTGVALSVATNDVRSTVCATDDVGDQLEELQDTLGEGPTVEALRSGGSVLVADLAEADGRWPGFTPAASEMGVRAVFVLPLRMGAARLGVLTLHRTSPGPLDDGQFKDAWVLAEAATVMLMFNTQDGQPAEAASWVLGDRSRFRPEVHQAVGATMVHLDVGARDAFARICAHAFASTTPIGEVAADIVAKRLRLEKDPRD